MSHIAPGRGPSVNRLAVAALIAVLVALLVGAFWWTGRDDGTDRAGDDTAPSGGATASVTPMPTPTPSPTPSASPTPTPTPTPSPTPSARPKKPLVVAVSIDGLASYAVTPEQMPVLTRLRREGASTLNARTAYEMTVTLPNHTGMVTGRRIDASAGGHGVTWNESSDRNVRSGVSSVFSVIEDAGGKTSVFAGKSKFRMWDRSWPGDIDVLAINGRLDALTDAVIGDLESARRDLTFFHISAPDLAGHANGWDSDAYDDAVRRADAALGRVVAAVERDPDLADRTIFIVTADHGGEHGSKDHGNPTKVDDYRIPFVVWGPGVTAGDLYALNPDYADPGNGRPSYGGKQPVRNASMANLITDLLGLRAVPGSQVDAQQDLDVHEN